MENSKIKKLFRKKEKRSPMFKSPSHYWNASTTGLLHSKGSAHVELSVDPFNKRLIRIYCQSIDKMVNYKSIEYSSRTTIEHIIGRMIKVLRLSFKIEEFVLCETVGRCMAIDSGGGTKNKIAKHGEPFIFLEQNRRLLMSDDYILTILNYWKPMYGLSRRFDLCFASKATRMVACDDTSLSFLHEPPDSALSNESNHSFSVRSVDYFDKVTQTDFNTSPQPPVKPRRKSTQKSSNIGPQLLLLIGDNKEIPPTYQVTDRLEFGTPESSCRFVLTRLKQFPNRTVFVATKENIVSSENPNSKNKHRVFIDIPEHIRDLPVLINGRQILEKSLIRPGDILQVGNEYAFFFKDLTQLDDSSTKFNFYLNKSTVQAVENDLTSSEVSEPIHTSSSEATSTSERRRRNERIDLFGIDLECFDLVFNLVIIHYFEDKLDLDHAVGFGIYLIRYCRESSRCGFTLEQMQNRITKSLRKNMENAYAENYYLVGNFKIMAFLYELWLLYNFESGSKIDTTETDDWKEYLSIKTTELFDFVAQDICDKAADLALCICEEMPLTTSYEEQEKNRLYSDSRTMQKFIQYLTDVYACIDAIGGSGRPIDAIKRTLTNRIIIYATESVITMFLSEMDSFSWPKGIQILTQIEKFENFLKKHGCEDVYECDGVLYDLGKLLSVRVKVLKNRSWDDIRSEHPNMPSCVLRQYLCSIAAKEDPQLLEKWCPKQMGFRNELTLDVTVPLMQYKQSAMDHTLFGPIEKLHRIDCLPLDKILDNVDYVSLATIMDTELSGMGHVFRWMSLQRPDSLINFRSNCWEALRDSLVTGPLDSIQMKPSDMGTQSFGVTVAPARKTVDRIKKKAAQQDSGSSDYFSASQRTTNGAPPRPPLRRKKSAQSHQTLPTERVTNSKSMMSLVDPQLAAVPTPPIKKHLSNSKKMTDNASCSNLYVGGNNRMGSLSGKSCTSRIERQSNGVTGRSGGTGGSDGGGRARGGSVASVLDLSDDSDIDNIDNEIEKMNKMMLDEQDCGDDDEMSVGLSATGLASRLHYNGGQSGRKLSDPSSIVEIDSDRTAVVTLEKEASQSYGITIINGMQTELKTNGVYVYNLSRNSVAARAKLLSPGDKILAINDYTVENLSFDECLMLISKSMTSVRLTIEKSDLNTSMKMMSVYR